MKFRTRIFITTFLLSVAVLGSAGFFVYAFSSRSDNESTAAAEKAIADLDAVLVSSNIREADANALRKSVIPIRRDIAKRTVLSEDRKISSLALSMGFLFIEAIVALIVSATLAMVLTKRWTRLGMGLSALRFADKSWRFSSGQTDEFGLVEKQLDELLDSLSGRERMKSELKALQGWGEAAAFMAHQARTPLASITMSARTARELLAEVAAGSGNVALRDAVDKTESEAQRLSALFKRMRSLSGFSEPRMAQVDYGKIFREAAAIVAVTNPAIAINCIETNFVANCRFPPFDESYLREIFINLINNSAEASAERGQMFSARLAEELRPGSREFVYSDGISGLDPRILDKIGTNRFTTKREGSGLGVWLVGRIMALHGASLRMELSGVGGLVFILSFTEQEHD